MKGGGGGGGIVGLWLKAGIEGSNEATWMSLAPLYMWSLHTMSPTYTSVLQVASVRIPHRIHVIQTIQNVHENTSNRKQNRGRPMDAHFNTVSDWSKNLGSASGFLELFALLTCVNGMNRHAGTGVGCF